MRLLDTAIAHFDRVQNTLRISPRLRRIAAILFLLLVGGFQSHMLPALAKTPFYLIPLIPIAFLETLPVALAFCGLAAVISLGADIRADFASASLIYPYWSALARLIGFVLITTGISVAIRENVRLRASEQILRDQARELESKNLALEENLREVRRLQEALVAKERQAAIAEAAQAATYEMQRPLMSISAFSEELQHLVPPDASVHPIAEKISERVEDIERILKGVREAGEAKRPPAETKS
jgi:signal transduction histidine kinase